MGNKKQREDRCAVNRDLMPMCIDGTASEASQRKVRKHVNECEACATVYQEMQTSVDLNVPDEVEKQQFDTAVKRVRHQHTRRKVGMVLLGVALALAVCAAAAYGYYWYFIEEVPVDVTSYNMELVLRQSEGDAPVILRVSNMPRRARVNLRVQAEGQKLGADGQLQPNLKMYLWVSTTREFIAKNGTCDMNYYSFDMVDTNLWAIFDETYEIKNIVQGAPGDAAKVLYSDGDKLKWNGTDLVLYSIDRIKVDDVVMPMITAVPTDAAF